MIIPQAYDSTTLIHWLWFKYLCAECTFTEFQRLFENIMKRSNPDFLQIRPYGNIGDRKCDGLLFADSTVFQVYSPNSLTQSEVISKIEEDLEGAVSIWGEDLKKWVFVYNVRRGLAPDIPRYLQEKQKKYPNINIDHLSNDKLWEIARNLSLQQRSEILGSPSGYEKYFQLPKPNETTAQNNDPGKRPWIVLIHDLLIPADIGDMLEALKPDVPFGAPFFIRPQTESWDQAAEYQKTIIDDLFAKSRASFPPRFAIFSIAPIPLIFHLGFLLTDSVTTRYYKLHLDSRSWQWPNIDESEVDLNIHVKGIPTNITNEAKDIILRVSLSATVQPFETNEIIPDEPIQIDMYIDNPDRMWLRSPKQIEKVGSEFRNILKLIQSNVPKAQKIHLFYAGPAPCALIMGQQINPRMNPEVILYEYSRQGNPRYQEVIKLKN